MQQDILNKEIGGATAWNKHLVRFCFALYVEIVKPISALSIKQDERCLFMKIALPFGTSLRFCCWGWSERHPIPIGFGA
jgi:hypothetical protein